MKITVISNMCICGVFEPPVKIELEVLTDLCEIVEMVSLGG